MKWLCFRNFVAPFPTAPQLRSLTLRGSPLPHALRLLSPTLRGGDRWARWSLFGCATSVPTGRGCLPNATSLATKPTSFLPNLASFGNSRFPPSTRSGFVSAIPWPLSQTAPPLPLPHAAPALLSPTLRGGDRWARWSLFGLRDQRADREGVPAECHLPRRKPATLLMLMALFSSFREAAPIQLHRERALGAHSQTAW